MFKFKEFDIKQDQSAMKVGTDGVLLGAWVDVSNAPKSILDVGTGTGLIALQMAQRTIAQIDALEPDDLAFEEAIFNFENSDWGDRLFCYHADFSSFVLEFEDEESYDLIVSNPPYHSENYRSQDKNRDKARHQHALPFENLVKGVSKLLSHNGEFAVVLPYAQEEISIKISESYGLYPKRLLRVKGNKMAPIKRSFLQFSFCKCEYLSEELIIEVSRHNYTKNYIDLVKPFYLKL